MPSDRETATRPTLVISMPAELRERVEKHARDNDLTMSQIARAALRAYLADQQSLAS
jgi:predicted transcriptional regulator